MCHAVSKYEIKRVAFAVKITIIAGTLFAAIDEFVQSFIPGRYFTIYDMIANIIGVWLSPIIFIYIIMPVIKKYQIRNENA